MQISWKYIASTCISLQQDGTGNLKSFLVESEAPYKSYKVNTMAADNLGKYGAMPSSEIA